MQITGLQGIDVDVSCSVKHAEKQEKGYHFEEKNLYLMVNYP